MDILFFLYYYFLSSHLLLHFSLPWFFLKILLFTKSQLSYRTNGYHCIGSVAKSRAWGQVVVYCQDCPKAETLLL